MSKNFVYFMGLIAVQALMGCSYLSTKNESAEATATKMNSDSVRNVAGLKDASLPCSDVKSPSILLPEFVSIQVKEFTMGSPLSEEDRKRDERPHLVKLTENFEIQKTEVTQAQWFLVMGSNPSHFSRKSDCSDDYIEINGTGLCPNYPVEMLSWDDVEKYIGKLNQGSDGYRYRLPTEAEWEFAARGGTQTAYSFGDKVGSPGDEVEFLGNYAWYSDNSGLKTHTVASKFVNGYKLYDMHGNVWEWVQDWYYQNYLPESQTDPSNPTSASRRVLRGGSWNSDTRNLRSAARSSDEPGSRFNNVGFRLVRTGKQLPHR